MTFNQSELLEVEKLKSNIIKLLDYVSDLVILILRQDTSKEHWGGKKVSINKNYNEAYTSVPVKITKEKRAIETEFSNLN